MTHRMLVLAITGLMLTGCATPKPDWASRVGAYTFDQTVLELGPPDKQAQLEDGTRVAEWLTRRGQVLSHPAMGYYGYQPWGFFPPAYPPYVEFYTPDYWLRLTFSADGTLRGWKRFAK
ncbi:MAG: hypothetical protein KIS67_00950 [Verrucomicrobiae bacterium]|nr:hypothetical protein [Verrucomicrobiae bacterium]